MRLPKDLVKLIKIYLNANNILLFIDIINNYNQKISLAYFDDYIDARTSSNRQSSNFNHPELQSRFTPSLNEGRAKYYFVKFIFDDRDYAKVTNQIIMDFIVNNYLNCGLGNYLYLIAGVNTLLKQYRFPYYLIAFDKSSSTVWGKII